MLTGSFCFYILSIFLSNSLLMFFKMLQLCQFLSQKMCFTYRWGRENYFNGDQITLFVVGIPTKKGQRKKEQNIYTFMVYLFQGLVAIGEKKWTWSPLTKQVYILITYVLLTLRRRKMARGVKI